MDMGRHRDWKVPMIVGVLLLLVGAAAMGPGASSAGDGDGPPIVLISVDPLRVDRVRADSGELMPAMDRFLADATYFPRGYAASSWTAPSLATVLTGRLPSGTGVLDADHRICNSTETLTERLRAEGYTTVAWTGGGNAGSRYGFDQGFDEYHEPGFRYTIRNSRSPRIIPPKIHRWLDGREDDRFFILGQGFDLHVPYLIPDAKRRVTQRAYPEYYTNWNEVNDDYWAARDSGRETSPLRLWFRNLSLDPRSERLLRTDEVGERRSRYLRDMYDNQVYYFDQAFGRIVGTLRARGLYDDALIVVYSHHGEELGEHGQFGHRQLYEETIRIPIAVKRPHQTESRVVRSRVSLREIYATVLSAAELPVDRGTPLSEFPVNGTAGPVFAEEAEERAIILNDIKLIVNKRTGESELYNLTADPAEQNDISSRHPELVGSLRATMRSRYPRRDLGDCEVGG